MEDWNWKTIFTDNIGLYSTTATYLASKEIEIGKKTQNKGHYAVQGHPRSSKVIEIGTNRKPVCDVLLVINSNWHPISYRLALIVQILDTLRFWATLWGLRDNVRCSSFAHWKARSGLPISDNWTFFARCYGWGATSEIDRKSAISLQRSQFDPKFQVEGVEPHYFCMDG